MQPLPEVNTAVANQPVSQNEIQPTLAPLPIPTTLPTQESLPTLMLAAIPSTPLPTETPLLTLEPEPTAEPTPLISEPEWLNYLNIFRGQAGLPYLIEEHNWSVDAGLHSQYMVITGKLWHDEDEADNPWFSDNGKVVAENGNIAISWADAAPYRWAINFWMSALVSYDWRSNRSDSSFNLLHI